MPDLIELLAADLSRGDSLRGVVGTVSGVSGRKVTVSIAGGSVASIPCARVYTSPQNGDVVLILKLGSAWLALTALG